MTDKRNNKNKNTNNMVSRRGIYALVISVVVLAVIVTVNILADRLPATWTQLDISSSKLYSVTSNTKAVLNNLDQNVTIYWIVQNDEEDSIVENLLDKYDSLSDRVSVVRRNPDVYPTFAEQYTDEEVTNNSLVVVSGDRSRYVAYEDMYEIDIDYTTYSYDEWFDGEGVITSAIDYVVTDDLPVMYLLEGHGENELPSSFASPVEKANIETESLSLLTVDEIPDDADCILIYAPVSDIAEEEYNMLSEWISEGGDLMVISGPLEDGSLDNLNRLLEDYDIEVADGIVVEGDRSHYAYYYPYLLIPDLDPGEITEDLINANYSVVIPIASGLIVSESEDEEDDPITELLTTSADSFSKIAGYDLNTYEMEEDDIEGPFTLGVSIETDGGGNLIWFSSSDFLEESYDLTSSGANTTLAMNAISSMLGEREAIAIPSKSLNYTYLTIENSAARILEIVMIGVLPAGFLAIGVIVLVRRRRLQNEKG